VRRGRAVLLLALLPVAGAAGEEAAPPRRTVERLAETLESAESRLLRLVERAKADPRIARVDRYRAATRSTIRPGTKRETTPRDLVQFLADSAAPLAVRESARDGLVDPACRAFDPDLATGRGGKRGALSRDHLVPLLASKDEVSRRLSSEVLGVLWLPVDPAIRRYDPRDASTWKDAQTAWARFLRGR
jgi:hypothetical protein